MAVQGERAGEERSWHAVEGLEILGRGVSVLTPVENYFICFWKSTGIVGIPAQRPRPPCLITGFNGNLRRGEARAKQGPGAGAGRGGTQGLRARSLGPGVLYPDHPRCERVITYVAGGGDREACGAQGEETTEHDRALRLLGPWGRGTNKDGDACTTGLLGGRLPPTVSLIPIPSGAMHRRERGSGLRRLQVQTPPLRRPGRVTSASLSPSPLSLVSSS